MAFYDTQSQLVNMARSRDRMNSILQNRANAEATLNKERAAAITKGLQDVARITGSALDKAAEDKRSRELLASVVPSLGATQEQKEALLKAKNLTEAGIVAQLQQNNWTSKSFGGGKGVTYNNWTGTPTFWGADDKPKLMERTEDFNSDYSTMAPNEIQELVENGGLVYDTRGKDKVYYPTTKYRPLRAEQLQRKKLGK